MVFLLEVFLIFPNDDDGGENTSLKNIPKLFTFEMTADYYFEMHRRKLE